jgi:hypothetical protein
VLERCETDPYPLRVVGLALAVTVSASETLYATGKDFADPGLDVINP